jgi:hypothetical protein
LPFTYINRQGRVYYVHVTITRAGDHAGQRRYYCSRRPERALPQLPTGFVISGEAPVTGVPVLKKVARSGAGADPGSGTGG